MGSPIALDRFRLLDVVRGLAILGVVWQHIYYGHFAGEASALIVGDVHIYPFVFNNGFLGVNLFFVISGFVLFHPKLLQDFPVWPYYRKRAMRLWPLYLVVLAFCFAEKPVPLVNGVLTTVALLSGVHNLLPRIWSPDQLWVLWSLGVEILFSLALPILVTACARFGVLRIAACVLAFCFIYRIAADQLYFAQVPDSPSRLIHPYKDTIFGRLDDFMIGISASYLYRKGVKVSAAAMISAVACALAAGYLWNVIDVSHRNTAISTLASLANPLFSVSAAVLILGLMEKRLWQRSVFFPIVLMGQCCYSAYLVHAVLLKYFSRYFFYYSVLSTAKFFVILFATSLALFILVEAVGIQRKPEWLRGVWGAMRGAPIAERS